MVRNYNTAIWRNYLNDFSMDEVAKLDKQYDAGGFLVLVHIFYPMPVPDDWVENWGEEYSGLDDSI